MMKCDLCGGDDSQIVLKCPNLEGPLVRCSSCGLTYVGTRRSALAFGSDSPDAVVQRIRQANRSFQHLRLEEEHRLSLLNARSRLKIIRKYCPTGRLLDVGCAHGDFLKVAREFYDVYGVEPNPELAVSAKQVGPIHEGLIETMHVDGFDVAASFHVIEHVDSPRGFLQAMVQRVRTGGYVVIETPNIAAIPFKVFRSKWREFIPEHYYFFTPATMNRLMQGSGLDVERIFSVGKYASIEFILNRLSRYSGLLNPIARLCRWVPTSAATFHINPRDIMLVVARKR